MGLEMPPLKMRNLPNVLRMAERFAKPWKSQEVPGFGAMPLGKLKMPDKEPWSLLVDMTDASFLGMSPEGSLVLFQDVLSVPRWLELLKDGKLTVISDGVPLELTLEKA